MFRVLILEDEAMLRASMARAIHKVPNVVVVEAGTVAQALTALDAHGVDLILSDIDLPDRSGVELLGELGRRALNVPLVFISAYLKAYGSQIPPHARVQVLEKPVPVDELRALVQRHAQAVDDNDHAPFGVPDYVQLACMGRHSVVVEVALPQGGKGRVLVVNGELHHAVDAAGDGEHAFQRLAMAPGAKVHCFTLAEEPGPRTIHQSAEALLLDAARLQDEASNTADEAPVPPPVAAPVPVALPPPAPPQETYDSVFDDAINAMLDKDHARAFQLFLKARTLRPGDAKVEANLKRLRDMGFGNA